MRGVAKHLEDAYPGTNKGRTVSVIPLATEVGRHAGSEQTMIVFAIVARFAADPVRTFTFVVAPIGLVVSWLFDVALYVSRAFPGTTGRGVVALMSLHVIAGVITVLLLRAQGLSKPSGQQA